MADVSRGPVPDDRGQLFLVGAILLALVLVTLALLLNTVIYTDNVATRDASTDVAPAIEYESSSIAATERIVDEVNDHGGSVDAADLTADTLSNVSRWGDAVSAHRAVRGSSTGISNATVTNGSRVYQDPNGGNFTPHDGSEANWTLAENATVRNFTITGNLSDAPTEPDDAFHVAFDDGEDRYTVHLHGNGAGTDCVSVRDDDEQELNRTCIDGSPEVVVDLANGTIAPKDNTTDTAAFDVSFFENVSRGHEVGFVNGDEIEGGYELFVDTKPDDLEDDTFHTGDRSEEPFAEHAVYDVEYELVYRSPTLRYETCTRVAADELAYENPTEVCRG